MLHGRSRFGLLRVACALAVTCALVLAACGGDDDDDDAAATTTGKKVETTTTAGKEKPDDTTTPSTATSVTGSDASADAWRATAAEHRAALGEEFTQSCPPDGTQFPIWGVETYTVDSSVCTAAVHMQLIDFDDGGDVTYQIAPGLDRYDSAIGGGVLSELYGRYDASFFFTNILPDAREFTHGPETWSRTAIVYQVPVGEQLTVTCAAGGPTTTSVWGTDPFTADSSVCTAAVFAGLVTVEDGGDVTFEMSEGEDFYDTGTANGITTSGYGSYDESFTFPTDQP
jgi:hypothetical protein